MGLRTKLREHFKRKRPTSLKSTSSPSAQHKRSRNAQSTSGSLSVAQLDSFDAMIKSVRHESRQDVNAPPSHQVPIPTPPRASEASPSINDATTLSHGAPARPTYPSLRVVVIAIIFAHRLDFSVSKKVDGSIAAEGSISTVQESPSSCSSTTPPSSPRTPCPVKRSSSWPTLPTIVTSTGSISSVDTDYRGHIRFALTHAHDEEYLTATAGSKRNDTKAGRDEADTVPWALEPDTDGEKMSTGTVPEAVMPTEATVVEMYSKPWGFETAVIGSATDCSDEEMSTDSDLLNTETPSVVAQDMTNVVRVARRYKHQAKRLISSAKRQIAKSKQDWETVVRGKDAEIAALSRRINTSTDALNKQLSDAQEKAAVSKAKDDAYIKKQEEHLEYEFNRGFAANTRELRHYKEKLDKTQDAYKKKGASKEKWKTRCREAENMKAILQRQINALTDRDNHDMGQINDERFGYLENQVEALKIELKAALEQSELNHNAVIATELAIKTSDSRIKYVQERNQQLISECHEASDETQKLRKELEAREATISRCDAEEPENTLRRSETKKSLVSLKRQLERVFANISSEVAAANWFNGTILEDAEGLPFDPVRCIAQLEEAVMIQYKDIETFVNSNIAEEKDAEEKSRRLEAAHEQIRELKATIETKDKWIDEVEARNSKLDDIVLQWELKEQTAQSMIETMTPIYHNFRLRFLYYKTRNAELERERRHHWALQYGIIDIGPKAQAQIDGLRDRVDQLTEEQEPLYEQLKATKQQMQSQEVESTKKFIDLEREKKNETEKLAEHIRIYEPQFTLESKDPHEAQEAEIHGPPEPEPIRDPALRQINEAAERMHVRRMAGQDPGISQELIQKHVPEGMENFVEDDRTNEEFHLDQAGIPRPDYLNPEDKIDSFQLERPIRAVPRATPFVLSEVVRRGLVVENWQDHEKELEANDEEEL
ncbi:hypothetical protein BU16DRAFT_543937 [Lophium mytilinum]|uniref:Uncharacterized protein n=1 Tax=Lophium mytilinum TaxID=390894 RepID=A0A6A6QF35_9PEZI|nr:hypothetical protein BU16DRAFT_543937 [Lophium mytilinum]